MSLSDWKASWIIWLWVVGLNYINLLISQIFDQCIIRSTYPLAYELSPFSNLSGLSVMRWLSSDLPAPVWWFLVYSAESWYISTTNPDWTNGDWNLQVLLILVVHTQNQPDRRIISKTPVTKANIPTTCYKTYRFSPKSAIYPIPLRANPRLAKPCQELTS
jgi:hypothetical protein